MFSPTINRYYSLALQHFIRNRSVFLESLHFLFILYYQYNNDVALQEIEDKCFVKECSSNKK